METGRSGRPEGAAEGALRAAFGAGAGDPGPADSAAGLAWCSAVALAGRGRFAAARTRTRTVADGPFASAARCLEASMVRQSGRHRDASSLDGAALGAALDARTHPASPLDVASRVDAAVGLAADALGTGRFALAARMLDRADGYLALAPGSEPWWTVPRARLRRDWVAAELAVYSGDADGAALAVAGLIAADPGPEKPRHHAKTQLIVAAGLASTGDPDGAREAADRAYQVATRDGLNPLWWAGAKLLTALSVAGRGERFVREAAEREAEWIRDGAELIRM
ncbi:hypothetical protein [Tsukamurella sp. 1534]|uniref:hypothetical protein n=1 Tax=Tsukamurella sp. 1534 TaxID=1151061 RepID=UPI0003047868|nr:hypothetical protein [Tsukamurella sp. 1534]